MLVRIFWLLSSLLHIHEGSALQKKMLSSAKRRWDTEGHTRVTRIPVIFHWFSAWLRRLTSASVHRIKMKGDKGSPWRRPLSRTIFPPWLPIHEHFVSNRSNTSHYPSNLNFWKTHLSHNCFNERPLHSIIRFTRICLNGHSLYKIIIIIIKWLVYISNSHIYKNEYI